MASSIVLQESRNLIGGKYPIRNQKQTGSCVAHAVVKAMGINNYLEEGKVFRTYLLDIFMLIDQIKAKECMD